MYVYTLCVCLVSPQSKRRDWIPWYWSYRQLWYNTCVLGTEPTSSGRVAVLLTVEPSLQSRNVKGFHPIEPTQRKHKSEHIVMRKSTGTHRKELLLSVNLRKFKWKEKKKNLQNKQLLETEMRNAFSVRSQYEIHIWPLGGSTVLCSVGLIRQQLPAQTTAGEPWGVFFYLPRMSRSSHDIQVKSTD